jgi:gamma-butyrobetaine dioxygenase
MTGADLELMAGGRRLRFPAVWLRDNCPCPECRDPGSGQKLKDITEIPNDLGVAASADAGKSVLVTFAPDGHRSAFSRSWLAAHALDGYAGGDGRTEEDKELWLAADLVLPQASWPRYLDRPADRIRALEDVLRRGGLASTLAVLRRQEDQ